MKHLLTIVCVTAAFLSGSLAAADTGPERLANPQLEARAVALQRELRCVVCQSQSLDESDAPLAADLRRLIRLMILKRRTDSEIENYLVARYGDFVLMKPPLEPETWLLWFGPLVVTAIAGAVAGGAIFRARRLARAEGPD
jgi:cytochrome c-type biogenesis protein CcmH